MQQTLMLCRAEAGKKAQALDGDVELSSKTTTCSMHVVRSIEQVHHPPIEWTHCTIIRFRGTFISYSARSRTPTLRKHPIGQ